MPPNLIIEFAQRAKAIDHSELSVSETSSNNETNRNHEMQDFHVIFKSLLY